MTKFRLIINFLMLFLLFFCRSEQKSNLSEQISVEWKLIANYQHGRNGALACFTIRNGSRISLNSSDWILYFNMAPRTLLPADDIVKADIMHINGDWYKLVPRNDFSLEPGGEQIIYYRFEGCIRKKSDAPTGLYFVFYDHEGKEEAIVPVGNYSIQPLIRKEQYHCTNSENGIPPVNEYRYRLYGSITTAGKPDILPLIPSPAKYEAKNDSFLLDERWKILYDRRLKNEAAFLQKKLKELVFIELVLKENDGSENPAIRLIYNPTYTKESYRLKASQGSVEIEGTPAGTFYGIQSLLHFIPCQAFKNKPKWLRMPVIYIEDQPRFPYRGQHIDVCRNFQTKEQLMKIIDLMAMYKLNRLHLYLSEDEGWRLEIRTLPELTGIGARRGHTLDGSDRLPPAYGSGGLTNAPGNYGTGYYSQEDFVEILRFATERHIKVIPSINLPGHARAAIKAMEARYNNYMSIGNAEKADEFRLIDPDDLSEYESAQYYNDNVVCVARESVYHFFETVVDEVIALYKEAGAPLHMIYTGGDEVPQGTWTRSPLCDSLLALHPEIGDPRNLQNYFFGRILNILAERDLEAGGWEEVVLKRTPGGHEEVNTEFSKRNVIPYIWSNLGDNRDLGYRIANAGYRIILCPVTNFYFDLAYDYDPSEPGLYWGGYTSERDAWEFSPYDMLSTTGDFGSLDPGKRSPAQNIRFESIRPEMKANILGLQAELWHETIHGGDMMEYYLLPKMIAFAERCWAPSPQWESITDPETRTQLINKSWACFFNTLYQQELPRLRYINGGYNYRVPPPGYRIIDGNIHVREALPGFEIRYTQNGESPNQTSALYKSSPIPLSGEIMLIAYDKAGQSSHVVKVIANP